MKTADSVTNQAGATLIEAVIAIMLLTIGILAVMAMQIRAISSSSAAMDQTDADNMATSFLEMLQELPFSDANLQSTGAAQNLSCNNPNAIVVSPSSNARLYQAINFNSSPQEEQIKTFILQPNGFPAGTVTDSSGHAYTLSWTVQDCSFTSGSSAGGTPSKLITVFMSWGSFGAAPVASVDNEI